MALTICDEVLAVDETIRFVAHLDEELHLVEMKMRPGIRSLTDEKTDEQFFSLLEPIVLGACAKLENGFGELKTIRVKYSRASIVFLRIPGAILGISMESGPTTPVIEKIGQRYKVNLT